MDWATQRLPNRLENTVHVIKYLIVPESQHAKPGLLQKDRTFSICFNVFSVLTAVQLDNESPFQTNEVEDVIPERVLTPEFAVAKLPSTKTTPEVSLGFGRRSAQPALQPWFKDGAVGLGFHSLNRAAADDWRSMQPIPTLPLPLKGRA